MLSLYRFIAVLFIVALVVLSPAASMAVQESSSLSTDNRIRTYIYDPNEVFVFTGHYRFQSSIELSPDETIQNISIGDSVSWQIIPSGSRIFLKPIDQDATTNMTVITDKRIYHFELYAEEADDIRDEEMIFSVRFSYPNDGSLSNAGLRHFPYDKAAHDLEDDIAQNPQKYNFNYTLSGSRLISPLQVFDDGEFTYLKFKDKNGDLPAIFVVDVEGNEALVNYRIQDDFLVLERVSSQYTLRHGVDVACVFNEAKPLHEKKK